MRTCKGIWSLVSVKKSGEKLFIFYPVFLLLKSFCLRTNIKHLTQNFFTISKFVESTLLLIVFLTLFSVFYLVMKRCFSYLIHNIKALEIWRIRLRGSILSIHSSLILYSQGHPTTVFCKISLRRSKYCLEFSITWGRLKISRWPFHSCTIFEAHLINPPRFSEV